jgi:Kef-type K+ transport system membrane component KefB
LLTTRGSDKEQMVTSLFFIFFGAALLATLALFTRQSLLVAYILLGVLLGPYGLELVADPDLIAEMADIGIIFLLFLLGLNLHPQNLIHMLRSASLATLASTLIFGAFAWFVAYLFHFSIGDQAVIAIAMTFSSTIIGLKLLPTTVLHHQRMGEIVISVLLLQDLIAIVTLIILNAAGTVGISFSEIFWLAISLPGLGLFCFLTERYVMRPLLLRFDRIQEYIFLLAIGWCLGVAQLAHCMNLSYEIGAFIGGVSIATGPIALFISESLKPLRDFFLVLFFFALGAKFNLAILPSVWLPTLVLAFGLLTLKPVVFFGLNKPLIGSNR